MPKSINLQPKRNVELKNVAWIKEKAKGLMTAIIVCDCGNQFQKRAKSRHITTACHLAYLNSIPT